MQVGSIEASVFSSWQELARELRSIVKPKLDGVIREYFEALQKADSIGCAVNIKEAWKIAILDLSKHMKELKEGVEKVNEQLSSSDNPTLIIQEHLALELELELTDYRLNSLWKVIKEIAGQDLPAR